MSENPTSLSCTNYNFWQRLVYFFRHELFSEIKLQKLWIYSVNAIKFYWIIKFYVRNIKIK